MVAIDRAPPTGVVAEVSVGQGGAVVYVQGDVDLASAPELGAQLADAVRHGPRLVIDLAGVTFLDSAGLTAIVRAYRASGQIAEALILRSPSPALRRLLATTGIDRLVTIEPAERPSPGLW